MPDVEGKENTIEEIQRELPQCNWNKDMESAWRMDIKVDFIEDSRNDKSETNIDVGVESDAESSDSESDKAESLATETDSD
jgi:hypothetical protein